MRGRGGERELEGRGKRERGGTQSSRVPFLESGDTLVFCCSRVRPFEFHCLLFEHKKHFCEEREDNNSDS